MRRAAPLIVAATFIVFTAIFAAAVRPNPDMCKVVRVIKVVDGDTFIIHGDEVVNLLGVDAPDLATSDEPDECFAKESRKFAQSKLEGETIKMTFDGPRKDKRGHYRAWVRYGPMFSVFFNEEIIREGYAYSDRENPTWMQEEFNRLEEEAKEAKRGLWNACGDN